MVAFLATRHVGGYAAELFRVVAALYRAAHGIQKTIDVMWLQPFRKLRAQAHSEDKNGVPLPLAVP